MVLLAHAGVAVCVIVAATVLVALHDLDATAAVAIFGTAIALVGGSAIIAERRNNGTGGK